jgi:hypothetical protein
MANATLTISENIGTSVHCVSSMFLCPTATTHFTCPHTHHKFTTCRTVVPCPAITHLALLSHTWPCCHHTTTKWPYMYHYHQMALHVLLCSLPITIYHQLPPSSHSMVKLPTLFHKVVQTSLQYHSEVHVRSAVEDVMRLHYVTHSHTDKTRCSTHPSGTFVVNELTRNAVS